MAHGISDSRSTQVEYLDERNEAWCGGCVSIAADPGLVDRGSLRKKAPHIRPYRAISVHRRCLKRFARRAGELRRGWYPTVSLGHASNAFATRWRRSGSAHWSRWRYSSAVCSADLPQRARHNPCGPPHKPQHAAGTFRSEEHTSELQSRFDLVCRLLLEKKNTNLHSRSP